MSKGRLQGNTTKKFAKAERFLTMENHWVKYRKTPIFELPGADQSMYIPVSYRDFI